MLLDNDTYDVKMPSLEGKELVNVYTPHRVPLPKISADCPEVDTPVLYAHSNTIMVIVFYGR